jgi:hypothetical protein
MLVTVYETRWFPEIAQGRISLDPTRMAQGIMTGIGFLGAGTIVKEGLSVRGLTTAAPPSGSRRPSAYWSGLGSIFPPCSRLS